MKSSGEILNIVRREADLDSSLTPMMRDRLIALAREKFQRTTPEEQHNGN